MTDQEIHRGGCRCGGVKLAAEGEPIWVSYCHCADCRRATGAPVSAFVGFPAAKLLVDGAMSQYANGPVSRSFCPHCGTPLLYRDDRLDNEIYVLVGAMDQPERYRPHVHGFYDQKLDWLTVEDDLLHDSGFTRQRPAKGLEQ